MLTSACQPHSLFPDAPVVASAARKASTTWLCGGISERCGPNTYTCRRIGYRHISSSRPTNPDIKVLVLVHAASHAICRSQMRLEDHVVASCGLRIISTPPSTTTAMSHMYISLY